MVLQSSVSSQHERQCVCSLLVFHQSTKYYCWFYIVCNLRPSHIHILRLIQTLNIKLNILMSIHYASILFYFIILHHLCSYVNLLQFSKKNYTFFFYFKTRLLLIDRSMRIVFESNIKIRLKIRIKKFYKIFL